eukprot:UN3972
MTSHGLNLILQQISEMRRAFRVKTVGRLGYYEDHGRCTGTFCVFGSPVIFLLFVSACCFELDLLRSVLSSLCDSSSARCMHDDGTTHACFAALAVWNGLPRLEEADVRWHAWRKHLLPVHGCPVKGAQMTAPFASTWLS